MVWFPEAFVKSKSRAQDGYDFRFCVSAFWFWPALQPRGQPEVH